MDHSRRRRIEIELVTLILAVFVALGLLSNLPWHLGPYRNVGNSLTYDELSHIPSGYYYLTTGRYDLNPEHPPLVKDVAALPLLSLPIDAPKLTPAQRIQSDIQWTYGARVIFGSSVSPATIINRARIAVTILNALLLLLLYLAWRPVIGRQAGILALAFAALNPFIIANGSIVTTDVPAAILMGASLGVAAGLLDHLQRRLPTLKLAIIYGLLIGLALLAKFSAIVLLPITGLILLVYIGLVRRNWHALVSTVLALLVSAAVAFVVVMALYVPQTRNMEADGISATATTLLISAKAQYAIPLVSRIPKIPVVGKGIGEYLVGVLFVQSRVDTGDNQIFFAGHVYGYKGAGPLYFPTTYIAKMPLALSVLGLMTLALGLYLWRKQRRIWGNPRVIVVLAGFALAYLIIAASTTLQIGVRYIAADLICVPILTAIAAVMLTRNPGAPKWYRTAFLGLAILTFVPLITGFPYYLSYTNIAFGGTSQGYRLADDSDYDWGQDLGRVDDWAQTHHIQRLYIYGLVNPYLPTDEYFKTDMIQFPDAAMAANLPKGSYYATSTTLYEFANAPGTGHKPQLPPVSAAVARPAPSWFVFKKS